MSAISNLARAFTGLGIMACAACVDIAPRPEPVAAPRVFYTVTAEIALSRNQPRVAALEYAAAAETDRNVGLLERAAQVTAQCLQPSLTAVVTARWIDVDPTSIEAHRVAASAALQLDHIDRSAAHYRAVLSAAPLDTEPEFAALDTELATSDNIFGARRLADRIAESYPASAAALRMQAFAALRADDPVAAARDFDAALSAPDFAAVDEETRREMTQGLRRAKILSGDAEQPLAQAYALLEQDDRSVNRLDLAVLLLAAQRTAAARVQLLALLRDPEYTAVALRLLGLVDFQDGKLDDAATEFTQLLTVGKFLDDAAYYLGLIAERREDLERALRLYAQVQSGDNEVPALLRAAALLQTHGAAPAAQELLDRLVDEVPLRAPEILGAHARIDADAGDPVQAMAVLRAARMQYPDSVQLRYAQASLLDEQGHLALALRELRAVVKQRPDDPAALNAYGYTLANHDRKLRAARKLIERAYAAAPRNPAILDSLGWVLFRQGHGEQAVPFLRAAYADDGGGDIAAHLGEVLWRLGRQEDAKGVWSQGERADSDNALLKSTRRRLHASD